MTAGRWLWVWGPAVAQMAAIFVASSLSTLPSLPGGLTNHTGHFAGYAVLGALLVRALAQATWAGVTRPIATTAWLCSVAYGVTDELHQTFVPARTPALDDLVADALGAAVGIGVVLVWRRAIARPPQTPAL
jgi:VanZ family protein